MKAAIVTLGCKINQCESESLARVLTAHGYDVVYNAEDADLYVINTCAVTQEADRKSRQTVHKLLKLNPTATAVVTGCSSQRNAQEFTLIPRVVSVGGTYGKCDWLRDFLDGKTDGDYFTVGSVYPSEPAQERHRTREYVKVQDGCDRFCSYCIIPYVRGRSRSRPVEDIVRQVDASNAKEIVLTGIDLSDYGKGIGCGLTSLLKQIRHPRIRLGSLEPNAIMPELLDVMRDPRFCKHFHLSMQSGSDAVLAAMNRHYTSAEFLCKVELIRSCFPDADITTDYIAGFPTETEENHRESLETVRAAGFGAMHVFPFSVRNGTRAARLAQIPKAVRTARAHEIAEAARVSSRAYLESILGTRDEVLTETFDGTGVRGYTTKYVEVRLPEGTPLNELIRTELVKITPDGEKIEGREVK